MTRLKKQAEFGSLALPKESKACDLPVLLAGSSILTTQLVPHPLSRFDALPTLTNMGARELLDVDDCIENRGL